jgi:2-polyprenyl-6-hydroxyphenyl methylase / 3-demethylubiquinone-9 3-methyltransferase
MASYKNADYREIKKFDRLSEIWWDPRGEMGTLHTINPLRLAFILEKLSIKNPKILDMGCGGGILSEALAKAGAQVTGIDLSQASIQIARQHAEAQGLEIEYRHVDIEDFSSEHAGTFDAVTCMEMLEHVPQPERIVSACARVLNRGGSAFFSSINRNLKSFLFAIIAGEYILHLLPRGSHNFHKLVRPQEMKIWARRNEFMFMRVASLIYNPITGKFKVAMDREDVNYMMHFVRLG